MPFVTTRTNRSISHEQEQQLKSRLGKAIWGNESHLGYDQFTAEVTR